MTALPEGLSADSDQSAALCEEQGCPTAYSALSKLLKSDARESLPKLLDHVDARMADFVERTKDHYVPCLEEGSVDVATEITEELTIQARLSCYQEFEGSFGGRVSNEYEQLVFGKTGNTGEVVVRLGILDEAVTTLWGRQSDTSLEIWHAANQKTSNAGSSLTHARLEDGVLEMALAGLNQFTVENPFECGAQIRSSAKGVYISGKLLPGTGGAHGTETCAAAETRVLCLNPDLSKNEDGLCEREGLTTFALDPIPQDLFLNETFGKSINIDFSKKVSMFRLEGLERI